MDQKMFSSCNLNEHQTRSWHNEELTRRRSATVPLSDTANRTWWLNIGNVYTQRHKCFHLKQFGRSKYNNPKCCVYWKCFVSFGYICHAPWKDQVSVSNFSTGCFFYFLYTSKFCQATASASIRKSFRGNNLIKLCITKNLYSLPLVWLSGVDNSENFWSKIA